MANDYQVKTKKGLDFFEVSSNLQKAIRRGDEKNALDSAIELAESGHMKYVWKRMIIMASEDVGLGEPSCIVQMMALKQSYDYLAEAKDKHKPERLPFVHAILCLVRSRKSRYVDHSITVHWQTYNERTVEIQDHALDNHTRRGKAMGRTLDFFYEEGSKIHNANKLEGEEELERIARGIDKCADIQRVDESCGINEGFSTTKRVVGNPTLF